MTERDGLRKSLDDTTALAGEMKKRLEKLGQNVDKLTGEKGEPRGLLRTPKSDWKNCASKRRRPRRGRQRSAIWSRGSSP